MSSTAISGSRSPLPRLMSATYNGEDQDCLDEATVRALAALKGLSASQLNWCSAPFVVREK